MCEAKEARIRRSRLWRTAALKNAALNASYAPRRLHGGQRQV
ncbi:hypothetical protein HMPREF0201_04097 [Cedecea davisae DSM 4568]|uniref:Uncharacterized protein n=1 Tax=Cedecea davisae DSM 4568 TaxID=566551 RepID=S3IJ65_9ENTR|nr:hypothetical protein HMPREF0201_04097 [Cedecea davisae DSM 4568]